MASSRTIQSPGVELKEIDKSQYKLQDTSLPNASVVLMTGFAAKGMNLYPQWINTTSKFIDSFGEPTTEEEKYLYNACASVLARGGVCIVCKLPYDNLESRNGGRFAYCDYKIDTKPFDLSAGFPELAALDQSLTQGLSVQASSKSTGTLDIDSLDQLKTGIRRNIANTIRIVDVSKTRYETADFNCVSTDYSSSGEISAWTNTNDALGIFPVITTATNAIYFQGLLDTLPNQISNATKYNVMSALTAVTPSQAGISVDLADLPANMLIPCSIASDESSNIKNLESISKIAIDLFPAIGFKSSSQLNHQHLKHIGIVVIKAFSDTANSKKVNFQILESFVGSLDRRETSEITGASLFIDDIVNSSSQYINVFSNVDPEALKRTSLLYAGNLTSTMLGFYEKDCEKKIYVYNETDTDSAHAEILDSLTQILDICKDTNQFNIDLVLDAGISNIAQFYYQFKNNPNAIFPIGVVTSAGDADQLWTLSKNDADIAGQTKKWKQVIKKFNDFCHFTRKDCMLITDGLRPFCLEGNSKKVRKTKKGSTVETEVLPYINRISGINSSYAAGYCNWFYIKDSFSGDYFWCPPSVQAASIYIYCDTYFHSWDAPAGMTRGIVPDALDVAFNPTRSDSDKIYLQSWNYAINYPLDGIIMEGQKTFQQQATALDRVNVRRLLLKLEKQVFNVSKYFLYDQNTEYHRQRFVDSIRPYFEAAVTGHGIREYIIQCDDTINTPDVIDNNELRCRIAIKPIKTIEFIVISFTLTSQSASVQEAILT